MSANDTPLMPILREEIRAAGGKITFARFMELCLYHPEHGYYNTERVKLGKHGDFHTSSHVGPVFARLLARHFELLWHELGKPERFDLVELGPGDGWFAAELLPWIATRFPEFFPHLHYIGVEQSPLGRARLRQRLSPYGDKAVVSDGLPTPGELPGGILGCVFANEFFDAIPFHIVAWRTNRWVERYVCLNGGRLMWCEGRPSSAVLKNFMGFYTNRGLEDESLQVRFGEIAPAASDWIQRIGALARRRSELLVFDYAYLQRQWEKGRFPEGTAMAYRSHRASESLLESPGEQDLTAHVNTTQLIEAGERFGLHLRASLDQGSFLLQIGEGNELKSIFIDCATELEWQQRAQQLKTLILPQGMGETFRVLQLRKGM